MAGVEVQLLFKIFEFRKVVQQHKQAQNQIPETFCKQWTRTGRGPGWSDMEWQHLQHQWVVC